MTKRIAVLLPLVLALVRCGDSPSSDTECHRINAVNSAGFAVDCPTGTGEFCAATPILATSSAHARGACDACFGAGACALSIGACGAGQESAGWEGSLKEPSRAPSRTEFQFLGSQPVAAGEISSGRSSDPACLPQGRWAP
jgi:hypothetical protein